MKHSELKKVLTAAGYTLTAERRYDVDRTRRAYEVRKDGALVAEFEGHVESNGIGASYHCAAVYARGPEYIAEREAAWARCGGNDHDLIVSRDSFRACVEGFGARTVREAQADMTPRIEQARVWIARRLTATN